MSTRWRRIRRWRRGLGPQRPSALLPREGEGADGKGSNEEDHVTQWLPEKRRMEIVMKNKNKANEHFSGDLEL
jgi:hypothetical protein